MTSIHEKAIAILQATEDGNKLAPRHLGLVQLMTNYGGTEAADVAFNELYSKVMAGTYDADKEYLFGIEHVTRDHEGYIYWKGVQVEHYSHDNRDDMMRAAERLAEKCRALEAKSFPVTGRSLLSEAVQEAPADTPWLEALLRYYTFFLNGDEVVAIFYRYGQPEAVALQKHPNGALTREFFESAYDAYHAIARRGFTSSCGQWGYNELRVILERSKLTPEEIHAAIH